MSGVGIRVDRVGAHIAALTIDRPPVNALGRELRTHFVETMDRLNADEEVRVVVLTAAGKVFSAGADIKEKRDIVSESQNYAAANRLTRDSFLALVESIKPVIAAVNGAALGAGFVMAACCDFIIASDTAVFAMPEIDVGQGGGASFLQRILPRSKVRRMALTGERVDAAEMFRLGAVEDVVPADQLMPRAVALAEVIAAKSPGAVRAIRGSFGVVGHLGLYEGFRYEQEYTTALSRTPEAAEARRAFLDKRKAKSE